MPQRPRDILEDIDLALGSLSTDQPRDILSDIDDVLGGVLMGTPSQPPPVSSAIPGRSMFGTLSTPDDGTLPSREQEASILAGTPQMVPPVSPALAGHVTGQPTGPSFNEIQDAKRQGIAPEELARAVTPPPSAGTMSVQLPPVGVRGTIPDNAYIRRSPEQVQGALQLESEILSSLPTSNEQDPRSRIQAPAPPKTLPVGPTRATLVENIIGLPSTSEPVGDTVAGFQQAISAIVPDALGAYFQGTAGGLATGVLDPLATLASGAYADTPAQAQAFVAPAMAAKEAFAQPEMARDPFEDPAALLSADWWMGNLGQLTGSVLSLVGTGWAGGAVGAGVARGLAGQLPISLLQKLAPLGAQGAAAVGESFLEASNTYTDLIANGADPRVAGEKAAGVFGGNMALLGLTNHPIFESGAGFARRALTEGTQEVGQTALGNVASDRPISEGMGTAAIMGALGGPAAGAAFDRIANGPEPWSPPGNPTARSVTPDVLPLSPQQRVGRAVAASQRARAASNFPGGPPPGGEATGGLPVAPKPTPPAPPAADTEGLFDAPDPLRPELRAILDKQFPNAPPAHWRVEAPGVLAQDPDPIMGEYGVGFRIDLTGDTPVVTSTGPKKDKQITNFLTQRFRDILKKHPDLPSLIGAGEAAQAADVLTEIDQALSEAEDTDDGADDSGDGPVIDARPYLTTKMRANWDGESDPDTVPSTDTDAYVPGQLEVWTGGQRAADLSSWMYEQEQMGATRDELANARFAAEARGVDVTRSDNLADLEQYLNGLDAEREDLGLPLAPSFPDEVEAGDTDIVSQIDAAVAGSETADGSETVSLPSLDVPDGNYTRNRPFKVGPFTYYTEVNDSATNPFVAAHIVKDGQIVGDYETHSAADGLEWARRTLPELMAKEQADPRRSVDPTSHKKLADYLKALGYENVKARKGGAVVVRVRKGKRTLKFTADPSGVGAGVFGHNASHMKTRAFKTFQADVARYREQPAPPKADLPVQDKKPAAAATTTVYRGRRQGQEDGPATWWTSDRGLAEHFSKGNPRRKAKGRVGEVAEDQIDLSSAVTLPYEVTDYLTPRQLAGKLGIEPQQTDAIADLDAPMRIHYFLEQPEVQAALRAKGITAVEAREKADRDRVVPTFLRLTPEKKAAPPVADRPAADGISPETRARWEREKPFEDERKRLAATLTDRADKGLEGDLHSFTGAAERWSKARATGLSDEDLKATISREFGQQGGRLDENAYTTHWGGQNPRFEAKWGADVIAKLSGKKLIDAARRVLQIPYPEGQSPADKKAAKGKKPAPPVQDKPDDGRIPGLGQPPAEAFASLQRGERTHVGEVGSIVDQQVEDAFERGLIASVDDVVRFATMPMGSYQGLITGHWKPEWLTDTQRARLERQRGGGDLPVRDKGTPAETGEVGDDVSDEDFEKEVTRRLEAKWAAERAAAEAEAAETPEADDTADEPNAPVVFRSGNQRAPADLDGYIKAGVPIGITHNASDSVWSKAVAYAQRGGQVFIDSGAFSGTPDFDKVLEHYGQFLNDVGKDYAGNVYIVAPDKLGNAAATVALQKQFANDIRGFIDAGATVIVPVQVSADLDQVKADAIEAARQFPGASLGLPSNKAAMSSEQLAGVVDALSDRVGRVAGFHFLGMGERNARYAEVIGIVTRAFPSALITADSNRTRALMAPGRPVDTQVKTLTRERADENVDSTPGVDTTELTGAFFRGERNAFKPAEIEQLATALGVTSDALRQAMTGRRVQELVDGSGLEQALDLALYEVAHARQRKTERPGARTDAIAEAESTGLPVEDKPRATRPDGRLEPKEGDEVYQTVRGFGGTPARINGVVVRNRTGQLRVKVTGTAAFIGSGPAKGKTYAVDENWTVKDDPAVAAARKKREDAEKARAEEHRNEHNAFVQKVHDQSRAAVTDEHHEYLTRSTPIGAKVVNYWMTDDDGRPTMSVVVGYLENGDPVIKSVEGDEIVGSDFTLGHPDEGDTWLGYSVVTRVAKMRVVPGGTNYPVYEVVRVDEPSWSSGGDASRGTFDRNSGVEWFDDRAPKKPAPPVEDKPVASSWGHTATMSPGAAFDWWEAAIEGGPVRARVEDRVGYVEGVDRSDRRKPVLVFTDDKGKTSRFLNANKVEPRWEGGQLVTKGKPAPPVAPKTIEFVVQPMRPGAAPQSLTVPADLPVADKGRAEAREKAQAELDAAVKDIRAAIKGLGNTTSSGPNIPPALLSATIRATRALGKLGVLQAQDAWDQLVDLIGADINAARAKVKDAFEAAWEATTGASVTVQDTPKSQAPSPKAAPQTWDEVKADAEARVRENLDALVDDYITAHPDHVVDNDRAKWFVSPTYAASRDNRVAFHSAVQDAAGTLANAVFERLLAKTKPGAFVRLVGGGPAAGKTTALANMSGPPVGVTLVATLRSPKALDKLVGQVIDHGAEPIVLLVLRDPLEAWRAAMRRAMGDEGRLAPIPYAVQTTQGAAETFLHAIEAWGDALSVGVMNVTNGEQSVGLPDSAAQARAFLEAYNEADVTAALTHATWDALEDGEISEAVAASAKPSGARPARAGDARRDGGEQQAQSGEDGEGRDGEVSDATGLDGTGQLPEPRSGGLDAAGNGGEGALGPVLPESGAAAQGEGPGRTGPDGTRDGVADGVSDAPGASAAPAADEGSGAGTVQSPDVAPTGTLSDPGAPPPDYTLTPERITAIIERGTMQRARDNIAAIRIVKELRAEQRHATPDEQETLAKYVGWGASDMAAFLAEKAGYGWKPTEKALWEELQGLTTEQERDALRRSTPNAHYTYDLYQPIWKVLEAAGFTGGRVLEPAVGSGHAFGLMPPAVRAASTLSASELDPLTATIAQALYPSAKVQAIGYEAIRLAHGTQDLVISNVPFGKFGVHDPRMPAFITEKIHNYFFAKALTHVRPGGLIVFVSSRFTMDGSDGSDLRRHLMKHAHFVGAVRLPNTAFDKSAKTEVVTDVIVLQRLMPGEKVGRNADLFIESEKSKTWSRVVHGRRGKVEQRSVYLSKWWAAHPELIVGTEGLEGTQYGGGEYAVTREREGLGEAIETALAKVLTPGTYQRPTAAAAPETKVVDGAFKPGELRMSADGKSVQRVDIHGQLSDATPKRKGAVDQKAVARIAGMVGVRDALRQTVRTMKSATTTDKEIAVAQRALVKSYDAFTKKFGFLNDRVNRGLFALDPEATNLLGLERTEANATLTTNKKGVETLRVTYRVTGKSDIFTKRTINAVREVDRAETPFDALMASIGSRTFIDWPYMARITGQSAEALQQALKADARIFEQPDGAWVIADEYLSGDVATKLADAEAAADQEPDRFTVNVKALQAVQPTPRTADQIHIGLGAHWLPLSDVQDFIASELDVPADSTTITRDGTEALTSWNLSFDFNAIKSGNVHPLAVKHSGGTYGFAQMLTDALNLKEPSLGHYEGRDPRVWIPDPKGTKAARANLEELGKRWLTWVYSDPARTDRLVADYNVRFNRTVTRSFDGSHLALPGLALPFKLYPHQLRAVWRILASGNTLLAHEVGAGKTFEMIVAAMEMRRTGRARKPMITVPTHLLSQWRADVLKAYPDAKILAFDDKDLAADRRQQAMARIAFGDWDIVLVPHSSFTLLKPSEAKTIALLQQWVTELMDAERKARAERGDDDGVKAMERVRRRIETKIQDRLAKAKKNSNDKALVWDDLGVDALFVDEAHTFKNLYFFTQLENLRGLSKSESDRALDLYVKIQDVNESSNYRNLVLATATPIMNSMAEMYTMQRYLQPQTLRHHGLHNFDHWYGMFAQALPSVEQRPDGTYHEVRRLKKFRNLDLLYRMASEVMDYVGWEDMPYLKLPKLKDGRITVVTTDPHPIYDKLKAWFSQRLAAIELLPPHYDKNKKIYIAPTRTDPLTGRPMTGVQDNILTIMNDARLAAVDVRLVLGDRVKDFAGSRIQQAARDLIAVYRAEKKRKGVSLVFLDVGTPKDPTTLEFLKGVTVEDDTDGGPLGTEDEDIDDDTLAVAEDPGQFNLYESLKQALMHYGVPSHEIAFIHQARNAAERLALFQAANEGRIRFLFASTEKGGVGMNIQERLAFIAHIDAPRAMRPGDLRQRDGRGLRQGNMYYEWGGIKIARYVTRGTTDEWLYGLLGSKSDTISQFMRGHATQSEDFDINSLSIEEAQMRSTMDPRGIELTELRASISRLEAQAEAQERARQAAARDVAMLSLRRTGVEADLSVLRDWLTGSHVSLRGDNFTIKIGGATYTSRADANVALIAQLKDVAAQDPEQGLIRVGEVGGLNLVARLWAPRYYTPTVKLFLDGEPFNGEPILIAEMEETKKGWDDLGAGRNLIASISDRYAGLPDRADNMQAEIAQMSTDIERSQKVLDRPTDAIEKVRAAKVRIQQIEEELKAEGTARAAEEANRERAAQSKRAEKEKAKAQKEAAEREARAQARRDKAIADRKADAQAQRDATGEGMPGDTEDQMPMSRGSGGPRQQMTSGAGGQSPLSGLPVQARPTPATGPDPSRDRRQRPAEIVRELGRIIGTPVLKGGFRARALALFDRQRQVIRTRILNDLPLMAHEFGHALDFTLGLDLKDRRWGSELIALGAPTSAPSYTNTKRRKEGAAEFFRLWLTDPTQLQRLAPNFLAAFEAAIDAKPDVYGKPLRQVQSDMLAYIAADAPTRMALRIDFDGKSAQAPTPTQDPAGWLEKMSIWWTDDLRSLKKAVEALAGGGPIAPMENAYLLARIARGSASKAHAFVTGGVRAWDGTFIAGGVNLAQAVKEVGDELETFAVYLVALRAVGDGGSPGLHARGIDTGFTNQEARETIRAIERRPDAARFMSARDKVYAFQDAVLAYAVRGRVLKGQSVRDMRNRDAFYVPFQRVMDEEGIASGMAKRIGDRTVPIFRIKGSGREIINPLESIIKNTFAMVDTVEKNRAMLALVEQSRVAERAGRGNQWLVPYAPKQKPTTISVDQVLETFFGATNPTLADVQLAGGLTGTETVTMWTPMVKGDKGEQVVGVLENGEMKLYQVVDPALFEAVTAIVPPTPDGSKLFDFAAGMLRTGATLTPGFILRNPVRDTLTAWVQSRHGFIPVYDTVKGFVRYVMHEAGIRDDQEVELFLASGVAQAALSGVDRKDLRRALLHMTPNGYLKHARSVVTSPRELMGVAMDLVTGPLAALSSATEVATRLSEFSNALRMGGDEGGVINRLASKVRPAPVTAESLAVATLAARDVTTDFSRAGTYARAHNRRAAFFNARVQGYVRMGETAARAPLGSALKLGTLGLMSIYFASLADDDDDFAELEDWEKLVYWHIPTADGFVRIPKPFDYAIVPDTMEALFTWLKTERPDAFRVLKARVFDIARSNFVGAFPTLALPLVEAMTNYSTFRQTNITPYWELRQTPTEDQYTDYTTETAKELSRRMVDLFGDDFALSPAQLDHLFFGYTAGLGRGFVEYGADPLLSALGLASRKQTLPGKARQQLPVIGNFIRDDEPGGGAPTLLRFFEAYDTLISGGTAARKATGEKGERINDLYDYVQKKQGTGDARRLERLAEQMEDWDWYQPKGPGDNPEKRMREAHKQIKDLREEFGGLLATDAMDPEEKREAIGALRREMIGWARFGLGERLPARWSGLPVLERR